MKATLAGFAIVLTLAATVGIWVLMREADEAESPEWRHIRTSLLENEFGSNRGYVARWTTSPHLKVLGANSEQDAYIRKVVSEMNTLTKKGSIQIELEDTDGPVITLVLSSRGYLPIVAENFRVKFKEDSAATSFIWYEPNGEIGESLALITNDRDERDVRESIIEELFQMMGPTKNTPYFQNSVIFRVPGEGSSAVAFAPIDRKLLRFLYTHLKPGDGEAAVRAAFDAHWADTPAD